MLSEYPDYELDKTYQEDYIVRQGGVIRLSVPIKGKPYPTCKWTKEGRDISHRAMIATSDERTELVIKEAHRDDTGTYDLVLENKCGKKAVYIKVKVIGRPDPPEGPLEFDDIQARSVRVSWRPPSEDGGSDILGYLVERREVPKAAWYTVDSRVVDTSLVVKGLKENVEYHFRVSAENLFGISRSLKSDESVIPKTPLCKHFYHVIFNFPICLITFNYVYIYNVLSMYLFWIKVLQNLPASLQKSWMLQRPQLAFLGQDQRMMVVLVSLDTMLREERFPLRNGCVITRLISQQQCILSLDSSLMQSTSSVWLLRMISVRVSQDLYQSQLYAKIHLVSSQPPVSPLIKLLIPSNLEKVKYMLNSSFVVLTDKPGQPGEIDIISIAKDCITIHWLRPESDGGKEILGYWIEYRQAGESAWKKCNKERSKDRQFTMGGLMEATEYEFRVFAENETGLSRPRRTAMGIKTKLSGKSIKCSLKAYI